MDSQRLIDNIITDIKELVGTKEELVLFYADE
jgi:hypothetical protein